MKGSHTAEGVFCFLFFLGKHVFLITLGIDESWSL